MHVHPDHLPGHSHDHDRHTQECSGSCQGCASQCAHSPLEEAKALMKYMVGHNAAHTQELADLAQRLKDAGNAAAAEQVLAAVADYDRGNMRMSLILASLEG